MRFENTLGVICKITGLAEVWETPLYTTRVLLTALACHMGAISPRWHVLDQNETVSKVRGLIYLHFST
jgi:hypothetical protein